MNFLKGDRRPSGRKADPTSSSQPLNPSDQVMDGTTEEEEANHDAFVVPVKKSELASAAEPATDGSAKPSAEPPTDGSAEPAADDIATAEPATDDAIVAAA